MRTMDMMVDEMGRPSELKIALPIISTPQAAMPGQSYPLVEKPNCRRSGGECGLENGEFELDLRVQWMSEDRIVLRLESAFPLDGVMIARACLGRPWLFAQAAAALKGQPVPADPSLKEQHPVLK